MIIGINLEAKGGIHQSIELFSDKMTQEEFLEGLESGDIVTSVGYNMSNGYVYDLREEGHRPIGRVICQESMDDMEFEDFELSEDY